MASKAVKIRVGIFVLVGMCLAVGAIIGLTAWMGREETIIGVTYFDESVSGLEPDAPVKYWGVKVGRVAAINISPDYKYVEVVMEIDAKRARAGREKKLNVVASLKMAGITGLKYIEIEPIPEGVQVEPLELSFKPQYPVIRSEPSELKEFGKELTRTFDNLNQVDVKLISDKLTGILDNLDALVAELKATGTIENLNASLAQFNNPKITDTIGHLESTMKSLNELMRELDAKGLPKKMDALVEEVMLLSRNLNALTFELQDITEINEVTRATAAAIKELNQTLKQSPSTLLFSEPPEPRLIRRE